MKRFVFLFLLFTFTFLSCEEEKKPLFYDTEENDSYETVDNGSEIDFPNIITVPYMEMNGLKLVNVSVNGFSFQMIFDTGCSGTLISVAEANYLYQKGYLVDGDVIGIEQSQIADGSIVENMVVNLKEVVIDGKIRCTDVKATVSANNNAPLLLGNEILNRAASYEVDNENQQIIFKLK